MSWRGGVHAYAVRFPLLSPIVRDSALLGRSRCRA